MRVELVAAIDSIESNSPGPHTEDPVGQTKVRLPGMDSNQGLRYDTVAGEL